MGASAGRGFANAEQGIQSLAFDALERLIGLGFLDALAVQHHILNPIDHPGLRRLSIPAAATRLLVKGLGVAWQIKVSHETDIGFVDAHAKGNGCDHDEALFQLKPSLVFPPRHGIEPGMVGEGLEARGIQKCSDLLGLASGLAVDDSGLSVSSLPQKWKQLLFWAFLGEKGVADVGAIKTGDETAR